MISDPHACDAVIDIQELTRTFGPKVALDRVNLRVPRGIVFGRVRVFGLDPVADPPGVLSRVGYLSEDNDLPGWMRVDELMRYTRAFYPHWDDAYAEELRQAFALDPAAKIRNLSRGQRARAGLLIALAHRP